MASDHCPPPHEGVPQEESTAPLLRAVFGEPERSRPSSQGPYTHTFILADNPWFEYRTPTIGMYAGERERRIKWRYALTFVRMAWRFSRWRTVLDPRWLPSMALWIRELRHWNPVDP